MPDPIAERRRALLYLQADPTPRPAPLAALVAAVEQGWTAEALLGRPPDELVAEFGMTPFAAQRIGAALAARAERSREDAAWTESAGVRVLPLGDTDYPRRWRRLPEPPPVVHAHGSLKITRTSLVAVVASRGVGEDELERLEQVATAIARRGAGLVGGQNTSAYQRSSLVAKRERALWVSVLDRGFREAFPRGPEAEPVSAARIWSVDRDLDRTLVLGPWPLAARWSPALAQQRDALVIALATAVVGVAVRPGGTMERLLLAAAERGTTVLLAGQAGGALDGIRQSHGDGEEVAAVLESIAARKD
jgi:hypothetical protein